jgi:enediyne biosynthesis protein E4
MLKAAGSPRVSYMDVTPSIGIHFRQNNSATPDKYLLETMTGGVAVFDYDNDGWEDIFLVNGARIRIGQRDGEPLDKSAPEFWNRLYRNNHNSTFTDVTGKAGGGGAATGWARRWEISTTMDSKISWSQITAA